MGYFNSIRDTILELGWYQGYKPNNPISFSGKCRRANPLILVTLSIIFYGVNLLRLEGRLIFC